MHSWLFPQRLGRLAWLVRFLLVLVPVLAILVLTWRRGLLRPYLGDTLSEVIGWTVAICAGIYSLFFVHLPRCRSLSLPNGALVFLFVPGGNVLLGMLFLFGGEGYWTRRQQAQYRPRQTPNDRNA